MQHAVIKSRVKPAWTRCRVTTRMCTKINFNNEHDCITRAPHLQFSWPGRASWTNHVLIICYAWLMSQVSKKLQGGVTPIGAVSRAATEVKLQSKGQGTFWGSVKRSSGVLGPIKRRGRAFAHAQLIDGQRVKNWPWSNGQGPFWTVKNLDRVRSSGHGAYGSDPPLIK